VFLSSDAVGANKETIETNDAYIGQHNVTVNVLCRNEVGLLEYYNLIVFDDTKLEYVSMAADRGVLWYGVYPTHVDGNRIYVHGAGSAPSYCIPPDYSEPGSPLFHINFHVKTGAPAGLAQVNFSTEGIWDGHWNDCSGEQVSPDPDYYDGGVNILGHAAHVTIGADSGAAGDQAAVDVYLHNDLGIFEYYNQILYDDAIAVVDSIVPIMGSLHYGGYPTRVSGDTIYVHGVATPEGCLSPDHSYPGASLYRIHFTLSEWAPPGYTMPLAYLEGSELWNHWVGCDLGTTDLFTSTDGFIYVEEPSAAGVPDGDIVCSRLDEIAPNPCRNGSVIRYHIQEAERATVTIYNITGKRVRTLADGPVTAGRHSISWDGTDEFGEQVASGAYFCTLETCTQTDTKKIVVLR
jgi:hypothetical protein